MRKRSYGYTLIELLLYIALVGILLSAVAAFFAVSGEARIKNQSVTEVNEQGTYAMDIMTQTVRNATSVSSPTIGTSGTQLSAVVPTSSLSPTVFSVSNGVLQIKEGTAATLPLTNNKVQVTALSITNVSRSGSSAIVRISMTLARLNTSGRSEYNYQRTFITSVGVRP